MKREDETNGGLRTDLSKGAKNDKGKNRLSLIDSGLILELGKVLTHGANKYAPNNWRLFDTINNSEERERMYNAQLRHLYAALDGEVYDKESGDDALMHQAQVAFYSMVLIRNELDRRKKEKFSESA